MLRIIGIASWKENYVSNSNRLWSPKGSRENREKLFVATVGEDDALARLQETQTLKATTLSITTRVTGIGFCHLVFLSASYNHTITVPNLHSMYRAYLGVVEAKIEIIHRGVIHSHLCLLRWRHRYHGRSNCYGSPRTYTSRCQCHIGIIKHEEQIFIPAVATGRSDNRGRFVIPWPQSLLLSNLREVVLNLANVATPEHQNSIAAYSIRRKLSHSWGNTGRLCPSKRERNHLREL